MIKYTFKLSNHEVLCKFITLMRINCHDTITGDIIKHNELSHLM